MNYWWFYPAMVLAFKSPWSFIRAATFWNGIGEIYWWYWDMNILYIYNCNVSWCLIIHHLASLQYLHHFEKIIKYTWWLFFKMVQFHHHISGYSMESLDPIIHQESYLVFFFYINLPAKIKAKDEQSHHQSRRHGIPKKQTQNPSMFLYM